MTIRPTGPMCTASPTHASPAEMSTGYALATVGHRIVPAS